jgi:hypothetical protein
MGHIHVADRSLPNYFLDAACNVWANFLRQCHFTPFHEAGKNRAKTGSDLDLGIPQSPAGEVPCIPTALGIIY